MQEKLDVVDPGNHTRREIAGQPELWRKVYELLLRKEEEMKTFLNPILEKLNVQIILTGAGSSAFVGEAAQGLVQKNTGRITRAIATTDIVTHPELYLCKTTPVLIFSFARSGNSPESLQTIKLVDTYCDDVFHFMITCNKYGDLMEYAAKNPNNSFALLLPEEANDKSLAMTGSFTSMLLSVILATTRNIKDFEAEIDKMIEQGKSLINNGNSIKKIASCNFERVVFLGSGTMLGIARECHLKLQELTDGQIICKHDSFLGFRHGPRAVINQKTLMVYLFSANDHVYQYELDLAKDISKDPRNIKSLSVGRQEEKAVRPYLNIDLKVGKGEELNIIPATVIGQLLGYFKSLQLGLNPDLPSVSGSISRVVQGVVIYDNPIL